MSVDECCVPAEHFVNLLNGSSNASVVRRDDLAPVRPVDFVAEKKRLSANIIEETDWTILCTRCHFWDCGLQ